MRLRDEATLRVRRADRRALWWAVVDVVLGFPAALLAGVSGAAGLATADARVPAAFLALLSAGLAAGAGFLRSDTRCVANKRARRAWAAVQDEAAQRFAGIAALGRRSPAGPSWLVGPARRSRISAQPRAPSGRCRTAPHFHKTAEKRQAALSAYEGKDGPGVARRGPLPGGRAGGRRGGQGRRRAGWSATTVQEPGAISV
ncbi:hypothetical protein ACIG3E_21235 [Streptomyces sp. NPDC053474]|uniref:hypothetical protein n=1 Tax=Streptomyces sp. NPDC053474 TaxID=3365704 RepID=UPI0037D451D8